MRQLIVLIVGMITQGKIKVLVPRVPLRRIRILTFKASSLAFDQAIISILLLIQSKRLFTVSNHRNNRIVLLNY